MLSSKTIDWELIRQQYDQIVNYTTALRLGTAEAEQVMRRFTRGGPKHPTYRVIEELGRAVRTALLALHLLQEVLAEPKWVDRLGDADRRALSPLFGTHVNPYGRFELDMSNRLDLGPAVAIPGRRTNGGRPAAENR
ncbi:Tn3 family transposase [Streptomyces alanosinicus]|uniref:Tn3 transposase DDE domain-containing protein n=1 Tax=Streptomyces alanosinicus TaxID=68171 RepID=A0A918YSI8_9ACTN|nr:hypothetical protein GCM10010339_88400 [Streptomyces alanosinicus]